MSQESKELHELRQGIYAREFVEAQKHNHTLPPTDAERLLSEWEADMLYGNEQLVCPEEFNGVGEQEPMEQEEDDNRDNE